MKIVDVPEVPMKHLDFQLVACPWGGRKLFRICKFAQVSKGYRNRIEALHTSGAELVFNCGNDGVLSEMEPGGPIHGGKYGLQ